jgi:hypothetical protein
MVEPMFSHRRFVWMSSCIFWWCSLILVSIYRQFARCTPNHTHRGCCIPSEVAEQIRNPTWRLWLQHVTPRSIVLFVFQNVKLQGWKVTVLFNTCIAECPESMHSLRYFHRFFLQTNYPGRAIKYFSFKLQYLLFSLRPSSNCLRLIPRLLFPSVFSSEFSTQDVTNPVSHPSVYCITKCL